MLTSETLNRAADVLQRDGWMNPTTWTAGLAPTCAQIAIGRVRVDGAEFATMRAAERALWTHIGGSDLADIWEWNDAPDRTAAEVIEVLRACALVESAKETADEREQVSV